MRYPEGENIRLSAPPGSGGRIPSTPSGDREKPDSSAESKIKDRNDRINNIGNSSSLLGRVAGTGIFGTGQQYPNNNSSAGADRTKEPPPLAQQTTQDSYNKPATLSKDYANAGKLKPGQVAVVTPDGGGKSVNIRGAVSVPLGESGASLIIQGGVNEQEKKPNQYTAGATVKVPLYPSNADETPSTPSTGNPRWGDSRATASGSGQSGQRGKWYDPWGQSRDASTSPRKPNASQSDSPARPLDIRSNAQRGATASGKGAHPSDQQKQPSSQHGASARERFFAMTDKLQNNDLDGAKQVVQGHRNSPEVQAQLNAGHQHNQHNQQIAAVDQSGSEIGGRGRG
ncbi:MAG: hypothetical protein FWG56_03205 [Desulfovibrionaceae bacterium]|nr:hypothetical protein [Desulfovibrionaceae bacterium]